MKKGPIYQQQSKCDERAGELTEKADAKQRRFIKWDWDYVLVNEEGKRVEGDVRKAVKKRVQEMYWDKTTTGQMCKQSNRDTGNSQSRTNRSISTIKGGADMGSMAFYGQTTERIDYKNYENQSGRSTEKKHNSGVWEESWTQSGI